MAIGRYNRCRDLLVLALDTAGKPLSRLSVVELGNQKVKSDDEGMLRRQTSKALLEWFGAKVVSIDRNGRDGALPFDLSQPLPASLHGTADIVTDFGTLEHVDNADLASPQWRAFANVHMLCRVGGLIVHALPAPGVRHGVWQYSGEWMRDVVGACGRYETLWLKVSNKRVDEEALEPYVYVMFRKADGELFSETGWVNPTRDSWRSSRGRRLARRRAAK